MFNFGLKCNILVLTPEPKFNYIALKAKIAKIAKMEPLKI